TVALEQRARFWARKLGTNMGRLHDPGSPEDAVPMTPTYDTRLTLYIDGERIGAAGRSTHTLINPATGEPLGLLPLATPDDLDLAVDTAARGFRIWRGKTADERGAVLAGAARLLRERIDKIATTATMEEGKTLMEARAEVMMAAALFEFYAGETK